MSKLTDQMRNWWGHLKMALHDIDKQNDDRANPALNADDNVNNRMSHKTIGTTYKTAGNPDTNRLIFDKGSIKGFDTNENNNIFIGYDPALSTRPIVRIAKDGYDQSTATNDQLIFNSDQNVFKIIEKNSTSITHPINTTLNLTYIDHSYGITPIVWAFFDTGAGSTYDQIPYTITSQSGANAGLTNSALTVTSTSNQIIFNLITPSFAGNTSYSTAYSYNITYYLLQETAN